MSNHDAFVTRVGRQFRLNDIPFHTLHIGSANVGVMRFRSDKPRLGMREWQAEDTYLIHFRLRKHRSALRLGEQFIPPHQTKKHSLRFFHLERGGSSEFQSPFDIIQFYIPRMSLDIIATDFGVRSIGALRCPDPDETDPAIVHLARSLLPSLSGEEDVCAPFVDHILLALQAHVALNYGEMNIPFRSGRESLSPSQVQRAKELMASRISGSVSLVELARECQLSVSHFARAFKGTIGVAPHRWLVEQKIERAKQLLKSTSLTMTDIALECGFSNRTSLSNAFKRTTGVNPGEWGRARRTSRSYLFSRRQLPTNS